MTDSISEHAGVIDSNGLIGGLMLIGGIIGALILPVLSDKFRKRKLFLIICIAGMIPGVFGLSFAGNLGVSSENTYLLLLVSSFIIGFFVMSAGPIGFQYAAVSYPVHESVSQVLLLCIGQFSGIVFVDGMSVDNHSHLGLFLVLLAILTVLSFVLVLFLCESSIIKREKG